MRINRDIVHDLYMEWVNMEADACEWKTSYSPEEIVNAICTIIEENNEYIISDVEK